MQKSARKLLHEAGIVRLCSQCGLKQPKTSRVETSYSNCGSTNCSLFTVAFAAVLAEDGHLTVSFQSKINEMTPVVVLEMRCQLEYKAID